MSKEQWDAMTREEQIEFVAAAFLAADRLVDAKIPDWAPADIVLPAMEIGLARAKAKLDQLRADVAESLRDAEPHGNA
jgi:hypothetical protein